MEFKPKNENLYNRLGVDKNTSKTRIKKAFFTAVRKYPPEKDPDNFKLLREAYDTLTNEQSRSEYDARSSLDGEIERLEDLLKEAKTDEDVKRTIKILKKIVVLAPELGIYRNKLGLAFLSNDKPEKAKIQFEKAISKDSKNIAYLINLGDAERLLKNSFKAEDYYKKAWDLDREDYSAPRALSSLYFMEMDLKDKAFEILEEAIEADGVVDFQDFFCIFDKFHYYALDNNKAKLEKELKRLLEIANTKEEKEFSAFQLMNTSIQLYDLKAFKIAFEFAKAAKNLDPNNKNIKEYYEECKKNLDFVVEFEKIMDKSNIHDFVKHLVSLYISRYFNEIDRMEFEKEINNTRDIIAKLLDTEPDRKEIINSIKKIRNKYPNIFNLNTELFESLLKVPEANNYREKCPHCGDSVIVERFRYGQYTCPHCNKSFKYSRTGYSGSDSSECFIATATLGDKNHHKVQILRKFRDEYLINYKMGRVFIKLYYRYSPNIADIISTRKILRDISYKILIKPLVIISEKVLKKEHNN